MEDFDDLGDLPKLVQFSSLKVPKAKLLVNDSMRSLKVFSDTTKVTTQDSYITSKLPAKKCHPDGKP